MRLLARDDNGKLSFCTFDGNVLPNYARFSHTWHADNSEEVTFENLKIGEAEKKTGLQ